MSGLLISFFSILLLLLSVFLILIILMQRASSNAGLGSAFGGGITESAFGAQAGNVLTRTTIVACSTFFVICFTLYLAHLHAARQGGDEPVLPNLQELATEAPATAPVNPPLVTQTIVSAEPAAEEDEAVESDALFDGLEELESLIEDEVIFDELFGPERDEP